MAVCGWGEGHVPAVRRCMHLRPKPACHPRSMTVSVPFMSMQWVTAHGSRGFASSCRLPRSLSGVTPSAASLLAGSRPQPWLAAQRLPPLQLPVAARGYAEDKRTAYQKDLAWDSLGARSAPPNKQHTFPESLSLPVRMVSQPKRT